MEKSIEIEGKELLKNLLRDMNIERIVISSMKMSTEVRQACDLKGNVICEGEEIKTLILEYKEIY